MYNKYVYTLSLLASCWFSRVRAVILACREETNAADAEKLCSACQHTHTHTNTRLSAGRGIKGMLRTTSYLLENRAGRDMSKAEVRPPSRMFR